MHSEALTVVVERPRPPTAPNGHLDLASSKQAVRTERRPGHQRRYAPKTRTGCITCKIRRVKCDEDKPFCKRCTTTGRKCDGYVSPGESTTLKSPEPLTVALANDVTCDALERRIFDFFRARTAPCVSGYFQDAVWDRIVLQLSHSEPAVRYAVNALGALHEERQLRHTADHNGTDAQLVKTGFPLSQYAKALNEMQSLLKSGGVSLDVVLICSLLCIHFEALRECFVPALMHAENAIQLLQSSTSFDARRVNPNLVRAIMRIDLQGAMYLGSRVPGLPFYTAAVDSVLPSSFHDLNHARDMVTTWSGRLFHFMRTVADDHKFREPGNIALEEYARAQELERTFIGMDKLLWDFMYKPSVKLTMREQHGLGMLRTRVKINLILSATCLFSESCIFDRYTEDFDEILTICLYILGSDNAERRLFSVSLDEGIIHPLFFVATHCRDGRIRHQALEQLDRLPKSGGIWHVETTIQTAKMCILWEESLTDKEQPLCEDIPEWQRIHSAGFDGWDDDNPKRTVKVHLRTRPNGMDGEWLDFYEEFGRAANKLPLQDLQKIWSAHETPMIKKYERPWCGVWGMEIVN
ncbi:Transcriptional regulatory moc3 [Lecanosticta acicola]|uniref:Transcriptional regulatory moc3 n=1 Tax=Lecanosticta acicola TaxID=111012 RepID=A0AAI8Z5I2_9PEZI|nr:Transcriptional regulatory moc3 [Lecanosticta acicola]